MKKSAENCPQESMGERIHNDASVIEKSVDGCSYSTVHHFAMKNAPKVEKYCMLEGRENEGHSACAKRGRNADWPFGIRTFLPR